MSKKVRDPFSFRPTVQGVSFEILRFETALPKRWLDLDTKFLDQNWFERWQFFVLDFEKNFWLCTKI